MASYQVTTHEKQFLTLINMSVSEIKHLEKMKGPEEYHALIYNSVNLKLFYSLRKINFPSGIVSENKYGKHSGSKLRKELNIHM